MSLQQLLALNPYTAQSVGCLDIPEALPKAYLALSGGCIEIIFPLKYSDSHVPYEETVRNSAMTCIQGAI